MLTVGLHMIAGTKPNDWRKIGTVLELKCMSIAHLNKYSAQGW